MKTLANNTPDEEVTKQTFWRKYEPALPIPIHYLLAGVIWIYVGQMLISYAIRWFRETVTSFLWVFIMVSVICAFSIYKFGFSKLAYKNIRRLEQKRKKICIFAFMTWQSYLIMVFMIGLGITLRSLIGPNPYLGILYNGIGGGILLAGFIYFRPIFQLIRSKNLKK